MVIFPQQLHHCIIMSQRTGQTTLGRLVPEISQAILQRLMRRGLPLKLTQKLAASRGLRGACRIGWPTCMSASRLVSVKAQVL